MWSVTCRAVGSPGPDDAPRVSPVAGKVRVPGLDGANRATTAFWLCVVAFFFLIPWHSDPTAAIIVMSVTARLASRGRFGPLRRQVKLALAGLAVLMLAGLLSAIIHPATLRHYPRVLLWMALALCGMAFGSRLPRCKTAPFWALAAGIVGTLLFASLVHGFGSTSLWHAERLKLLAIHPSRLGLYCAVCFFFFLHVCLETRGRIRVLGFGGLLVMLLLLCATNTRAIILALPVGLGVLAMTLRREQLIRLAAAVCVCLVLGCLSYVASGSKSIQRRMVSVTDIASDPTFRSRLPIWETGWAAFCDAPLLGQGPRGFGPWHAHYLEANREAWNRRYDAHYETAVKHAHNLVLSRMAETGLLGTAGFLVFYLTATVAAWRGPRPVRWLTALLVFYLVLNMADDGLWRANDGLIFFVAGMALTVPGSRGRGKFEPAGKRGPLAQELQERLRGKGFQLLTDARHHRPHSYLDTGNPLQ